ncbi:MAG: ribonuclease HII [Betaproteobacteria bacterium]
MTKLICGVDEVGRGPLVGNVVAAAVILGNNTKIRGLRDSKKLSESRRNSLYLEIIESSKAWSIGQASSSEIDQLNILHATMLAMKRAIEGLSIIPTMVLVDGNRCPDISLPCKAIVRGDQLISEISAASILAKVTRDLQMHNLHLSYPQYGFDKHKGYPTEFHLLALKKYGAIKEHRQTFGPIKYITINREE